MSHNPTSDRKFNFLHTFLKGLPTILVLTLIGAGWMLMHHLNHASESPQEEHEAQEETAEVEMLVLPEGKLKAGKFESLPAASHAVQHQHTVPGRLRYDQTKHVDIKAPIDGILTEVLVTPGEVVKNGQPIAVIRSPEIGQARAEILKRQQQREIAQMILDREKTLAENLKQLTVLLDKNKPVDEIEAAFKDRPLGRYRQDILPAYSNMKLADELMKNLRPLVGTGAVSGRTHLESENQRQLAETAFRTAQDQTEFASKQAQLQAEADVAEADRQLNLAWQAIETLLGRKEDKETAKLTDEESLSRLEVRAPFSGSVESRGYANSERVMRGDSLIVLANTDSLTVEASIRESDWSAVGLKSGTPIKVLIPALEDQVFDARIRYFGREVQAETNSVPLVATIENKEGLLRPGMFVRVTLPVGNPREVLSVKPESIIQHENQQFVFVSLNGGAFKRVDVDTGQVSEEWVEITKGLLPGQLVVNNGAFLLKSEFLLQGEGE